MNFRRIFSELIPTVLFKLRSDGGITWKTRFCNLNEPASHHASTRIYVWRIPGTRNKNFEQSYLEIDVRPGVHSFFVDIHFDYISRLKLCCSLISKWTAKMNFRWIFNELIPTVLFKLRSDGGITWKTWFCNLKEPASHNESTRFYVWCIPGTRRKNLWAVISRDCGSVCSQFFFCWRSF